VDKENILCIQLNASQPSNEATSVTWENMNQTREN
jgi:hypothetical protein